MLLATNRGVKLIAHDRSTDKGKQVGDPVGPALRVANNCVAEYMCQQMPVHAARKDMHVAENPRGDVNQLETTHAGLLARVPHDLPGSSARPDV